MEWKKVMYAPAIQNLVQEILTNALDRQYRDATVRHISVWVDCDDAGGPRYIRIKNDGLGVPVVLDQQIQLWKPTIAFAHFRSGSNFADQDGPRYTAGRNGYGCKATNVFSTAFHVHTADPRTKMQLDQTFTHNMSVVLDPRVWSFPLKKGFTDVKFRLDLARLGEVAPSDRHEPMRPDLVDLVRTLTIHAVACLNKNVSITFNGVLLGGGSTPYLKQLAAVFTPQPSTDSVAYDVVKNEAGLSVFEVALVKCDTKAPCEGLGFVNSLECCEGTHMTFVLNRVVAAVEAVLRCKHKKGADFTLSPSLLKRHCFMVVKVLVDAPHFSSQTKERLSTPHGKFGFDWTPSAAFMRTLTAAGVVDAVYQDVVDKELVAARKTMSQKVGTMAGSRRMVVADKYDAATALRGSGKRKDCYLLVTEGDSARALAVAGLAVVGREQYGIYALKGKPLNVRNASVDAISKNKEVSTLMQILGLTLGKPVLSLDELNYRKLVIFSDQDPDGAHIGGLLLNLIHALFPSLLALDPAYVQRFPTPLVRATHKRTGHVACFYAKAAYDAWSAQQGAAASHYNIRYFKGLGTSTSALAREYFSQYSEHVVDIVHTPPADAVMVNMFGTEHSQARRALLTTHYSKELCVDYTQPSVTMEEFVYREVLPYSNYSNIRNIASVLDGLKPVQRKVLFTMLDKNMTSDVKVAQVVGVIAAHTQYHHGEQSLVETVVGMAQDHVGVSNINLLVPEGQFGSRLDAPSVHSAARYIFTRIDPVARYLFRKEDDAVLVYAEEEGDRVEPECYVPVIPMLLVNGTFGIGTGWSTSVPSYDPRQLMDVCEAVAQEHQRDGWEGVQRVLDRLCAPDVMLPYYDGFKGTLQYHAAAGHYISTGVVELGEKAVRITELPVGVWTHAYVEEVEKRMMVQRAKSPGTKHKPGSVTEDLVVAIDKHWTDAVVDMTLHCAADKWPQVAALADENPAGFHKALGLHSDVRVNNMHLHNTTHVLQKYDTVTSIVLEFARARLALYEKRKAHMLAAFQEEAQWLSQKHQFVTWVVRDGLAFTGLVDTEVDALLERHSYLRLHGSYDYLLNMPVKSFTADRASKLYEEWQRVERVLADLRGKTVYELWLTDLAELRQAYAAFLACKATRYAPLPTRAGGKEVQKGVKRTASASGSASKGRKK
jgi:DNA topoisomerase-2